MVYIYMCTSKNSDDICIPIILSHSLSLGNLIYNKAKRKPSDCIYELETIGM